LPVLAVLFSLIRFSAFFRKALILRDLKQISVIGLGLLGGSIASGVLRCFSGVKVVGFSHRPSTREKARELTVASEVLDSLERSVEKADLVILATPIGTFEDIFGRIAEVLPDGCVVTDVGSTKVLPHRWAAQKLPRRVQYVGSHPIAGSELRGVDFARDDLCDRAMCILTATQKTNPQAVKLLEEFWTKLGCSVKFMKPAEHDRIFANVSHVPHITAAALTNAMSGKELRFAGKGFMDTSRIASGPANIWADVLLTNTGNISKGIDKVIAELLKLKKAVDNKDREKVEKLLAAAKNKRAALIDYKIEQKEIL
ncbi:MAG: prephenate dehydrogenase/arogenate dehydrogenase family protein, partial [Sedimentisphaerales bacterium]|nr:prephenate dehydrogenase/arogenate dehydrogenase family protein [Sedimentisphaerales bacterium]